MSICEASKDLILIVGNFTNILRAAFLSIFLHQKSIKSNFKYKKAARKTFAWKSCA